MDIDECVSRVLSANLNSVEKFLLICLLRNGLRVSEICNLKDWEIRNNFESVTFCQKNKVFRTVLHCEASQFVENGLTSTDLRSFARDRFYYYRVLSRLIPDYSHFRQKNRAVTHAARYARASSVFASTGSVEAAAAAIGNKSKKATLHYLAHAAAKTIKRAGVLVAPSGSTGVIKVSRRGVIYILNKS